MGAVRLTPREAPPMKHSSPTRRGFLRRSAAAAAVLAAPNFLRAQNANTRLNIAVIGSGGRGASNLASVSSENIVALCDVFQPAVERAAQKYPQAAKFNDFRRLYDQHKTFDAVVVS